MFESGREVTEGVNITATSWWVQWRLKSKTPSIVSSIVCSAADQRKHQSSASLAFVRGIHHWPAKSYHKGPTTRRMFPFDDVILNMRNELSWDWIVMFEYEHRGNRRRGPYLDRALESAVMSITEFLLIALWLYAAELMYVIAQWTHLTNPTMHETNIPQCTVSWQKWAHVCTFLLQNGAHCGTWVRRVRKLYLKSDNVNKQR